MKAKKAERFKYRSSGISGFISYFQARLPETSNRSEDLSESLFSTVAPAKSLTTDAVVVKRRRLEPRCLRQAEKQASIATKTQWKTFPEYWNSWEAKRKAGWTLTRNIPGWPSLPWQHLLTPPQCRADSWTRAHCRSHPWCLYSPWWWRWGGACLHREPPPSGSSLCRPRSPEAGKLIWHLGRRSGRNQERNSRINE